MRSNTDGVAKRINKGAEKMVFDILQSTQYSTPIPSTVRELVTNACDSQREKEMAIEILKGEKTEADYYIRRDGEQYADSNFDPTYYDLNHLNQDEDGVEIRYYRNEGIGYCDKIEIIDHGVGIGKRRLEGILELGYSTKRNTSQNFGAFGLGAKVALSTGVDFYTIETVHNGKRFKCNCYPYKTDFMIPKFNPHITFSDGTQVHYEETTDKNYTIVSFGVKKHNRQRFDDTIEEQLNYLGNVKYTIVEDGEDWDRPIHTKVLHNSKNIIVCDSYNHSRPHIVVVKEVGAETGINYGYVDFRELEMEQLWGAVGLKCPMRQAIKDPETGEEIVLQDGVEVTPSREKVIWNENTKNFIQGVIEAATEEASALVQEQLTSTDFLEWVKSCRDVLGSGLGRSEDTALKQISRIIDTSKMRPKFTADPSISYAGPEALLKGFSVRAVHEYTKAGKLHIETEKFTSWGDVDVDAVYFRDEDVSRSRVKDHYLYARHNGRFVIITYKNLTELQANTTNPALESVARAANLKEYNNCIANRNKVGPYLLASKSIRLYDEVDVPDEWVDEFKDREKVILDSDALMGLTPAEKRKAEQRICAYTLRFNHRSTSIYNDYEEFIWDKVEPKLATIMSSESLTYYGTMKDEDKLKLAATALFKQTRNLKDHYSPTYQVSGDIWNDPMFYRDEIVTRLSHWKDRDDFVNTVVKIANDSPQLLRVSEQNIKYIQRNPNCKHIDEFFCTWDEENNKLTMDNHLIKYLTARAVGKLPDWFAKLGNINPEYKELYSVLGEYERIASGYGSWKSPDNDSVEILDMVEKIKQFQEYAETVKDDQLLAEKSKELFIFTDVKATEAIDTEILRLIEAKDEFKDGVEELLDKLDFGYSQTDEFTKELKHYLKSRGKLDIEIPLPHNS